MLIHRQFLTGLLALFCTPLWAAQFVPTRFDDPAPDSCAPTDCSLREAVIAANALPGADEILLSVGNYRLTRPGFPGSELGGDLDVLDDLSIVGQGPSQSVVLGDFPTENHSSRLFFASNIQFALRGLALRRGRLYVGLPSFGGGALFAVDVNLQINNVDISECQGGPGAGLYLSGGSSELHAVRAFDNTGSAVSLFGHASNGSKIQLFANAANGGGGGLQMVDSDVRWDDSRIFGNKANFGGGVAVFGNSSLSPTSADQMLDISDNYSVTDGGGLHFDKDGSFRGERLGIRNNAAAGRGGGVSVLQKGLFVSPAVLQLRDSEIRDNVADGDGGGMYLIDSGSTLLERVSFAFNRSATFGGAIASDQSGLELVNVSTHNNWATRAGGLGLRRSATLTHVSSFRDSGGALYFSSQISLRNTVLSGACVNVSGGNLINQGGAAQASGFPACPGVPIHAPSALRLSFGAVGGLFAAVRFDSPGSVLRNAGVASSVTLDISRMPRTPPSDIGAFEWQ